MLKEDLLTDGTKKCAQWVWLEELTMSARLQFVTDQEPLLSQFQQLHAENVVDFHHQIWDALREDQTTDGTKKCAQMV